jgi:NagD protein
MDTDVRSGLEAGMKTILVLTGISDASTAERFPYRPTAVFGSIAELVGRSHDPFTTPTSAD